MSAAAASSPARWGSPPSPVPGEVVGSGSCAAPTGVANAYVALPPQATRLRRPPPSPGTGEGPARSARERAPRPRMRDGLRTRKQSALIFVALQRGVPAAEVRRRVIGALEELEERGVGVGRGA